MGAAPEAVSTTGLVLGAYRPLRPLGSGGSGSVWLAVHEPTQREVALKMVAREGRAGERAEREARAAAQLRHPHIMRAFALGRDPGHVYIAYEYVAGGTLRDAIREGRLRDGEALEAAAQILEALAHAHARGVVHRDVKPSNILLGETAGPGGPGGVNAKLLDFGLALVAEEETLTAQGDVPGTLAYISPERLRGHKGGPACDVWAVGVLLWEALAGRHPFWQGSLLDTARSIRIGAESLAGQRPDLPKQLVTLVDRALALDPADRPSAAVLASALREAPRRRNDERGRKGGSPARRAPRPGLKEKRPSARRRGPGGPGGRGPGGPGDRGGPGGPGDRTSAGTAVTAAASLDTRSAAARRSSERATRAPGAGTRTRAPRGSGAPSRSLRPSAPALARPGSDRLVAAGLAAVLSGWAAASIPFFPSGGAPALALAAALIALVSPGWALAFALAVPVLPLGNIATGAALAWGAFAAVWLLAFRRRPADGLLLAAAPLLGALSLLGAVPLAVAHVRSWPHRAGAALGLVVLGTLANGLGGRALPFGLAPTGSLHLDQTGSPVVVARALVQALEHRPALLAETVVLVLAAVALPYVKGRSAWWLAGFGIVLAGLTVAPVRGLSALPLAATAVLTCAVLAAPRVQWSRLREQAEGRTRGRAQAGSRDPQLDS